MSVSKKSMNSPPTHTGSQVGRTQDPADLTGFYSLRPGAVWGWLRTEHLSFWAICSYLFVEYVRPQRIITALDILPWAYLFLLLAFLGMFVDRSRRWVRHPANLWVAIFSLLLLVSCFTAIYQDEAWKHFEWYFQWWAIYTLIVVIVNSERRFLVFLAIFMIATFKISIFGARTWAMRGFAFTKWGLVGPPGYFENSGELAIQMLMFAPIAYEVAIFVRPYVGRLTFYVLLMMPITAAMTVMGASSRGGQLGLAYQAYRSLIKGRLSFKVLVSVGVLAVIAWQILPDEQKARFSSSGSDRTSQQRLLYWKHGWDMMLDRPMTGVGYFGFAPYYQDHFPDDLLYGVPQLPHNIFIQVGTDAGFPGLIAFLMVIYINLRTARDIQKLAREHGPASRPRDGPATPAGNSSVVDDKPFAAIAKGLAIACWGFVIAGQFVTVSYYPFLWINLALTVCLHNIAKQHYLGPLGVTTRKPLQPSAY